MSRTLPYIKGDGKCVKIKMIIFDFDGTLFDSMSIWETAGTDYLKSIGYTAEKDLHKKLAAMSLTQAAEYLKKQCKLPMTIEEIMSGINKTVEDFYFYHAMPKENVIEYLSILKSKGIKMCIATATERYQVESALTRCDMFKFFDGIFTCTEIGHSKDEPYIFECACIGMGTVKSETAVFEDAYYAAQTAKKAGFFVVGVYDKYEKRSEELKQLADVYVNSFSEIEELLNI